MVKKETNISHTSEASAPEQKCCHHWVVDMAAGPTSQGVCILCGAQKEFKNYLPDCLAVDNKRYEEWLRRQRDGKKRGKPGEDIVSWLEGGDRDGVKTGT